jgi:iron complex transport system permease protein
MTSHPVTPERAVRPDQQPLPGARRSVFFIALLALATVVVASLLCGVTSFTPWEAVSNDETRALILQLRLPRTLCAVVVGGGLAIVGAIYQSIFRNYLASPFTLGVSSGAALAASSALVLGFGSAWGGLDIGVYALLGALGSIGSILAVYRLNARNDSNTLLLIGIVFSFFCSSLLTLLQYVADFSQLFQVTRWMMGGIPLVSWDDLVLGTMCVLVVLVWALRNARGLDLMLFGDDLASVKGIDARRLTTATFVLTSFVVGWVVAQCGVIGFVGIIVPALSRLLVGVSHSRVLPISAVLGALLVVLCDLAGRMLIAPFEIPAGVFTAVLGGPAFVVLLCRPSRVW